MTLQHRPDSHSGRAAARGSARTRRGPRSKRQDHQQRQHGEEAAPERDLEAARGSRWRVTTPAMHVTTSGHGAAHQERTSRACVELRVHARSGLRERALPAAHQAPLMRFARGALAVVLLQVALAQADRLGRDLHQFVVVDELDRVLQRQLDRRRDLDRVFLAARRGSWSAACAHRVDHQVVVAAVDADDHALVHRVAGFTNMRPRSSSLPSA